MEEDSSRPSSTAANAAFTCDVCSSTFTRVDHVVRHKQSHTNHRTFSCPYCPKAFNRVDLLNRHKAIHERPADTNAGSTTKRARRATQACVACIAAKARCDNVKPCSRCRSKGGDCVVTVYQDVQHNYSQEASSSTEIPKTTGTAGSSQVEMLPSPPMSTPNPAPAASESQADKPRTPHCLVQPPVDNQPEQTHQGMLHLENIAAADISDLSAAMAPNFFQLDHNFSRDFDFDFANIELGSNGLFAMTESPGSTFQSTDGHSSTSHRFHASGYEAFRRSPWVWSPAEKDSAYAETHALNVDESQAATLPEIEYASSGHRLLVKPLTRDVRDQLLAMVVETSNIPTKRIQSFPSTKILNGLFQMYFYKTSSQVDNWIHPSSLDPSDSPIQLIGAIVAGGAQFIAEETIWTMGLALLESVRLSLSRMIDGDNTWTRNLFGIQTYRLWVDFGLWSGFKRKMEISESFGSIVMTMLRRAGAFRFAYYQEHDNLAVDMILDPDSLKANWMKWVRLESMKRLTLHTLIHDAQCSIAFAKAPSVNIVEYTLPLPVADAAWLASTASDWAANYQLAYNLPSLLEVLQDLRRLENLRDRVDVNLTHMVILYGIWAQIWNYHNARKFRFGLKQASRQAPSYLWYTSQYQELYQNLTSVRDYYAVMRDPFATELLLTAELFMMLLQVSFLDLQHVAGKEDVEEAQQAFKLLQDDWFDTREARCAVWHAGQVLRAASSLRPTTLRDFNAIAVYQAGLCLWVYGFIGSMDPARQTPTASNELGQRTGEQFRVMLNGNESPEKRSFIEYGQGIPCVSMPTPPGDCVVALTDQQSVMEIARATLRRSFPTDCRMPPLVENLSNLMEDLGKLASKTFQGND